MMRSIRVTLLFLIIILNITALNGCWDMREINEIGLVIAVGIDKADAPDKYAVTVQIANPSSESSSSDTKGGSKTGIWIATQQGDSLFDAARKLVDVSSRRIMWAHNNVIIIGEAMAREGIIPIVDYFTHNPELRMKTAVVVSKGDAKDFISAKVGMENLSGVAFILLEGYRALTAESVESHMLEVSGDLSNEFSNPLIAGIDMRKSALQTGGGESGGKSTDTVDLSGSAVFRKDKMIGWLSPEESRGAAWIMNETRDTVLTVKDPEHGNRSVSVETKSVKSKIKTKVTDGMPEISIQISGNGKIVEEDGETKQGINEMKRHIAVLLDKKIEEEIKNSLETIQKKYMVDVLDFATFTHIQNNRAWHSSGLDGRWKEIFPQIPVTVSVDITIKSSTLNQQPIKVY